MRIVEKPFSTPVSDESKSLSIKNNCRGEVRDDSMSLTDKPLSTPIGGQSRLFGIRQGRSYCLREVGDESMRLADEPQSTSGRGQSHLLGIRQSRSDHGGEVEEEGTSFVNKPQSTPVKEQSTLLGIRRSRSERKGELEEDSESFQDTPLSTPATQSRSGSRGEVEDDSTSLVDEFLSTPVREKNTFLCFALSNLAVARAARRSRSESPLASPTVSPGCTWADVGSGTGAQASEGLGDAARKVQLELLNNIMVAGAPRHGLRFVPALERVAAVHQEKLAQGERAAEAALGVSSPDEVAVRKGRAQPLKASSGAGVADAAALIGISGGAVAGRQSDTVAGSEGEDALMCGIDKDRSFSSSDTAPEGQNGSRFRGLLRASDRLSDGQAPCQQECPQTPAAQPLGVGAAQSMALDAKGLPSIGSAFHSENGCKPCAFFLSELGCKAGVQCRFCHVQSGHPSSIKLRFSKRKRKQLGRRILIISPSSELHQEHDSAQ